jgi:hypothetical protein
MFADFYQRGGESFDAVDGSSCNRVSLDAKVVYKTPLKPIWARQGYSLAYVF